MKTLLTIGHNTLLLPANTDPSAILKLLVGAKIVRHESRYTKETKEHRSGRYVSAEVIDEQSRERISVECVPDDDVCTLAEFNERFAAEEALAAKETDLPVAVG